MSSRIIIGSFGLALLTAACSGSAPSDLGVSGASGAERLVLDVRCAADAECPAGYECEVEAEHGATQSYCKSHDTVPAGATPTCPAGFESEPEHGATFCKPHGGGASGGGASSGGGGGADDDASTPSGTGASGASCTTTADCAAGLECEVEVEHGATTSTCTSHGGKK